jgi:hypothetical protein
MQSPKVDSKSQPEGKCKSEVPLPHCSKFPSMGSTFSSTTKSEANSSNRLFRPSTDDERIVLHEASHATVGRLLGQPLGGVTCDAGDGFSSRCWGPEFESKFASDDDSAPPLCEQIARLMPQSGEPGAEVADIFLHVHNRVVELVAGTEGERMFCDSEPWFAADDERQAFGYASLVSSSPAAAAAFIAFARVEAISLLTASAHVVRALAAELRVKRTMDGQTIDRCIEQAVAAKTLADEHARRASWKRAHASAARFHLDAKLSR